MAAVPKMSNLHILVYTRAPSQGSVSSDRLALNLKQISNELD